MSASSANPKDAPPVLLCFDGSANASKAIERAAHVLGPRRAVVLTVWEPVAVWAPYDPATIIEAPFADLASRSFGLDDIARDMARETAERGVKLARDAGFSAELQLARGKSWRAICDVAQEVGAEPIVVGARGLSRVRSLLLGSVSAAVLAHAGRPVLVIPDVLER